MPNLTIRTRTPKRELNRFLRGLPKQLSGKKPDTTRIRNVFFAAYANKYFAQVHKAFLKKSKGGTDELGVKWKKITQQTKAQRSVRPGDISRLAIGGRGSQAFKNRVRGLLTEDQDKRWRGIYFAFFKKLANRIGEVRARKRAAAIAWSILKKEGAKTKLNTLGRRNLPIGINTRQLVESLKPGTATGPRYHARKDQIYEITADGLQLGSDVPHAAAFHRKRPIWPGRTRRAKWHNKATESGREAVVRYLTTTL